MVHSKKRKVAVTLNHMGSSTGRLRKVFLEKKNKEKMQFNKPATKILFNYFQDNSLETSFTRRPREEVPILKDKK